jgi:folate-binding protein YgfZ
VLTEAHEALGARWIDWEGHRVPGRYRSVAAEHAALAAGRGLADRSWAGVLELAGQDRQRFLNAYLTCDVKSLQPGSSAYGFLTTAQGRILADVTVVSLADSFLLELPAGTPDTVAEHLSRYIIADQVEIRPRDLHPLTLFGAEAVRAAQLPEPAAGMARAGSAARIDLAGLSLIAESRHLWGLYALTLWVERESAGELWQRLLERGQQQGLEPVGLEALEVYRVEQGVPRFGPDFGPQSFPQETGLEEQAVSYTKGCYLGQEVVARIHYRGQVNRRVVGLLPEAPVESRAELLLEGRPVGTVGSAAESVALDRPVALAMVHRRGAQPGTRLEIAGGGSATVTPLPFVPR